jgi:acyl-CoA synthetase (AMP-forming)/AMP-acid ligase II
LNLTDEAGLMFSDAENIADALAHHARTRPGHAAVVQGGERVGYGEFHARVLKMAAWLAGRGLLPGDVVGIALRDSVEHLIALFALPRAGIVMLPMDWRWTAGEQQRVASHFGARMVLVEPGAAALEGCECAALDEARLREIASADPLAALHEGGGPLLMSLSSGTTGRPKGPRLTHQQFMRRFLVYWMNLGITSQDVYLSATPLYFGASRTFAMVMLYSGGTVHLFPPPHAPEALCAEVARSCASAVFLVPTMIRRLLALPDAVLAPFHAIRRLVSIGASLFPGERSAVLARLTPGFIDYYGSTEGGGSTYLTRHDPEAFSNSVGRPVFGIEVQCVDEAHRPVAPGAVGRVRVRGAVVATEFWNDPEGTRESFRDGWYYPGDLGALDEHGYLYLKGRAKDMIIRGGVNIYPAEVEEVLQSHPAVVDSAVVGWPSREFNEEIAAFVILGNPAAPAEALRDYCRGRLAPYKVPREVFVVDEFPRNSLGKAIKGELALRLPALDPS